MPGWPWTTLQKNLKDLFYNKKQMAMILSSLFLLYTLYKPIVGTKGLGKQEIETGLFFPPFKWPFSLC